MPTSWAADDKLKASVAVHLWGNMSGCMLDHGPVPESLAAYGEVFKYDTAVVASAAFPMAPACCRLVLGSTATLLYM